MEDTIYMVFVHIVVRVCLRCCFTNKAELYLVPLGELCGLVQSFVRCTPCSVAVTTRVQSR